MVEKRVQMDIEVEEIDVVEGYVATSTSRSDLPMIKIELKICRNKLYSSKLSF